MHEVPGLFRFAFALCGNRAQAEDLVATAMEHSLPRWERIESVSAYLRRAIINLHFNEVRSDGRRRRYVESTGPLLPHADGHDADTSIDIRAALSALTPLQRTVIVLRFFDQYTAENVAQMLGRPAGSVRRICSEALQVLRASPALRSPGTENATPSGKRKSRP
jgi:RNA polymerase sigma factor (sigma-70 family)